MLSRGSLLDPSSTYVNQKSNPLTVLNGVSNGTLPSTRLPLCLLAGVVKANHYKLQGRVVVTESLFPNEGIATSPVYEKTMPVRTHPASGWNVVGTGGQ